MIINDVTTQTLFASSVRNSLTKFVKAINELSMMKETYEKRGYAPLGADAIIDANITGSKITAADLEGILGATGFISKIETWMSDATIWGAGHACCDTTNIIRNDF